MLLQPAELCRQPVRKGPKGVAALRHHWPPHNLVGAAKLHHQGKQVPARAHPREPHQSQPRERQQPPQGKAA